MQVAKGISHDGKFMGLLFLNSVVAGPKSGVRVMFATQPQFMFASMAYKSFLAII